MIEKECTITLRDTKNEDLEKLFYFQTDEEAKWMAAFTASDSSDKRAYLTRFRKLLLNSEVNMKSIILNSDVIGSIAKFEMDGLNEITYWISREFWGNGIAKKVVAQFLNQEKTRHLYARVAFDNSRSIKVLEHAAFKLTGKEISHAGARRMEIEEFIYKLNDKNE